MTNLIVDGFATYGLGHSDAVSNALLSGAWAEEEGSLTGHTISQGLPWDTPDTSYWLKSTSDNGNNGTLRRVMPTSVNVAIASMYVAYPSLPPSNGGTGPIEFRDSSNTGIGTVYVQSTGAIQFDYGGGTVDTSGPVVVAESAHHFEMLIDITNKKFQLYVDGTKVIDATGLDFSNTNQIAQFSIGGTQNGQPFIYMTNIIIRDDQGSHNNTIMGDRRVATLFPNKDDASHDGWTARPLQHFGDGILDISSGNSGVDIAQTTASDPGSGEFTAEGWFRFQNLPTAADKAVMFGKWDAAANERGWQLYKGGPSLDNGYTTFRISTDGQSGTISNIVSWPWEPVTGVWYHVALERSGTETSLYIDGQRQGLAIADTNTYHAADAVTAIGVEMQGSGTVSDTGFDGWVDEFRLTIGAARYNGQFAPPTAPFPRGSGSDADWSDVVWLASFDNGSATDDGPAGRTVSLEGDAAAITPTDGDHDFQVVDKVTPDDDTFLEAALLAASGVLTMTAVPTAAETVTVGTTDGTTAAVYKWVSSLSSAYDVLIGGTVSDCLDNLAAAILAAAGEGTVYGTGTAANFDVTAEKLVNASQMRATALTPGTAGNSIASTATTADASWDASTLSGGANIPANSQFNLTRLPNETTIVDSITLVTRSWKLDAGAGQLQTSFVGSGGGVISGADRTISTVPTLYFDTVEEDPDNSGVSITPTAVLLGKVRIDRTV